MFQKRDLPSSTPWWPSRSRSGAVPVVSADAAFRQSAVWAALHLRANLISLFPIDAYRRGPGNIQMEVTKPPVLVSPSEDVLSMREWMYSTQIDLDRYGNAFGLITEVDGSDKPRRIDLLSQDAVTVATVKGKVVYRVKGKVVPTAQIWHERQYTIPGLPVGLSPIAFAAWSMSTWQSAAQFALEWFSNHGVSPNAQLQNTNKILADGEADRIKERFKVAVEGGDVFVTGKDWEFKPINAAIADAQFLNTMGDADAAAARFFGVPGDLIDVATKGQSITYANITQRNLQLLIMHLGGAVARREDALSSLLPAPRFVKLNTTAILRMDPETTSRILTSEVAGKITAPSEARALMNRQPFTDEQLAEFDALGITHQLPPAPLAPQIGGSK